MKNNYKNLEDFAKNVSIMSNAFFNKNVFEDGSYIHISQKSAIWHNPITVGFLKKNGFKCLVNSDEVISGCGLINIGNYLHIDKKDLISIIEIFIKYYESKKVGALFTTIGQSTPEYTLEAFIESGFMEVSEYINTLHGPNYKQKLLLLELN